MKQLLAILLFTGWFAPALCAADQPTARPNIVLIMTDDQGYGDIGFHGNPIIQTPNLDRLAAESARLTRFYVSPVCTPTRACLMTGRYNYRTRALDTFRGRAMMEPEEVTVAEMLRGAGYATGIFGKWHLGDCYPMRPMDQGFEASLVHRGGGIGQPSDPPGAEGKYTDAVLFRNGKPESTKGYCTDVYFAEGMKWADEQTVAGKPFFLYLPTNAPHGPFDDVPPDTYARYRGKPIDASSFPAEGGHPSPAKIDADTQARVYAMIENIDQNVGRLLRWLDERRLADKTLVLFLTDNGRATPGYNAGLRGQKGTVFEGGIRSPLFARLPGVLKAGDASSRIAAHIDIAPTLVELAGVKAPKEHEFDGRSLWPLLQGKDSDWPERILFAQAHRGDVPVRYLNCAARTDRWKLASPNGFQHEELPDEGPRWQLFDMQSDPYEKTNVAEQHPEVVADLKKRYDAWFDDVSSTRRDNYVPPRIIVGSSHEPLTVLTRQDWRGAGWGPQDVGYWELAVEGAGEYDVKVIAAPADRERKLELRVGDSETSVVFAARATEVVLPGQSWKPGPVKLQVSLVGGGPPSGPRFVEIEKAR